MEWVKPAGRRNEALDCAVYALAAAHYLGLERWKEPDWSRAEEHAQGRDLFDEAAQPVTPVDVRTGQADAPPEIQQPKRPTPRRIGRIGGFK
jgi:phage terminase large subunit GpA-like protein